MQLRSGILNSGKRFLASLIGILQTRLELLVNELQEEQQRLIQLLIWGVVALFCFCMGAVLFTAFIVVLFWEQHRLLAIGSLCLVFFGIALFCGLTLKQKLQQKSRLFAVSLAEFSKDREKLTSHYES